MDYAKLLLHHGYELKDFIGRGGYSEVYLVRSLKFDEHFAAKIINISGKTSEQIECLESEANILKKINHPNIISLYDVFFEGGFFFIITEYCPNGDLSDHIKKHGCIKGRAICNLAIQIIQALKYLHSHGIAHLDIKPQNILVGGYGRAKLTDFGTANYFDDNQKNLKFQCSKAYAPPEVYKRMPHDPFKRDIWSLGVTIYYLNTLEFPFNTESDESLSRSICLGIFCLSEDLDQSVKFFVVKCFALNPDERITLEKGLEIFNSEKSKFGSSSKYQRHHSMSIETCKQLNSYRSQQKLPYIQNSLQRSSLFANKISPSPPSPPSSSQNLKVFQNVGSAYFKKPRGSRLNRRRDSLDFFDLRVLDPTFQ